MEWFKESLADELTISNMAQSTVQLVDFPTDEETINYLKLTGKDKELNIVKEYSKNKLFG